VPLRLKTIIIRFTDPIKMDGKREDGRVLEDIIFVSEKMVQGLIS
jgi:hypothetical protein